MKFQFSNPKKAHPCLIPHRLSKNSLRDVTCRCVEEKRYIYSYKNFFAHISPIFRDASLGIFT